MVEIRITDRTDLDGFSRLNLAAVDENGTPLSKGTFTLTESSFGQTTLKTLLAGGIATPVHNRRGGNIRKMFDYMHDFAAKEGATVALLHPFSFAYYRMFGYEKVADHRIVRFPTRLIDFVPRRCNFVPYDETKLADMHTVYRTFSKGRNLLLKRFDDRHYTNEKRYTYICYDHDTPIAYIVYSTAQKFLVNHMTDGVLTVQEIAYTSPAALREIFSFLRMFEGEFDEIEFANCAMCPEIDLLLRHYTHTTYTVVPDLMARLLHTERFLSAHTYPTQKGAFTVRIEDPLPTVAGVFRVSYGNGASQVVRLDENDKSDLTLTSGAFIRLAYGYDGIGEAAATYMDGVTLHGNCADFFRAFPKVPCGIFEHF